MRLSPLTSLLRSSVSTQAYGELGAQHWHLDAGIVAIWAERTNKKRVGLSRGKGGNPGVVGERQI
jgi:hypothetical protein